MWYFLWDKGVGPLSQFVLMTFFLPYMVITSKLLPNYPYPIDLLLCKRLKFQYIIGFMLLGHTRHGKQIREHSRLFSVPFYFQKDFVATLIHRQT